MHAFIHPTIHPCLHRCTHTCIHVYIHAWNHPSNNPSMHPSMHPYMIHPTPILSPLVADDNECRDDNGGCMHICVNTDGHYTCECQTGYSLDLDQHQCIGE